MCAQVASLRASADFQRLSRLGKKLHTPSFIFFIHPQDEKDMPLRLGLTVSRKVGNAVVRNRAKRRLREIVRLTDPQKLQGVDIVLIAKTSAEERDFVLLQKDFKECLQKAGIVL